MRLSSQELLRTNAELRALIGALPDIFFRLDRDGVIPNCKGGTSDDFTLPAQQMVGKRIQGIPVTQVGLAFQKALGRIQETHAPTNLEYVLRVHGHEAHYEARLLPPLDL